MTRLDGKSALVCGGSDGLGFGAATELANLGCNIILAGRSTTKLKEKVEQINKINGLENKTVSIDFKNIDKLTTEIKTLVK